MPLLEATAACSALESRTSDATGLKLMKLTHGSIFKVFLLHRTTTVNFALLSVDSERELDQKMYAGLR